MDVDEADMAAPWGDNVPGAEQMALTDFAAQLGAHIAMGDAEGKKKEDIREEAEILLSLLSANPPSKNASVDEDDYPYAPEYQDDGDLIRRDPSFSFTCPLLSLEHRTHTHQDSIATQGGSDGSTTTEGSSPSSTDTTPAPAVLLGRMLVSNGSSEETEKTGDIMARNIAESFHKAVEWRIQTWIYSLSSILVQREKELMEAHANDDIIRELLDTAEARVLSCLQKAASDIEVVDTKTNMRVLSQRIDRSEELYHQGGAPPLKKRKVEELATLQTESEYKYAVAHVLSFESTINLKTPAGYTEVTIEAPGIIEGTFLSSDLGEDILTGVSVEVDTDVIAKAIERSGRIVARTATHALIPTNEDELEDEETPKEQEQTEEEAHSPTPDAQICNNEEATLAAIVTPHKTASSPLYEATDNIPIPNDFDNVAKEVVRMVSPQPRSPEYMSFSFTPRTPTSKIVSFLPLVSPPPPPSSSKVVTPPQPRPSSKSSSEDEESPSLFARKSPSLPALLQVACAEMEAC